MQSHSITHKAFINAAQKALDSQDTTDPGSHVMVTCLSTKQVPPSLKGLHHFPDTNHLPWRSAHRDWPGGLCSGHSCMFGDSLTDKLGKFWILSSSPSRLGTPRSAQGWHWKAGSSAGLSDKRNTHRWTQEPLLLAGCVPRCTHLGREKGSQPVNESGRSRGLRTEGNTSRRHV